MTLSGVISSRSTRTANRMQLCIVFCLALNLLLFGLMTKNVHAEDTYEHAISYFVVVYGVVRDERRGMLDWKIFRYDLEKDSVYDTYSPSDRSRAYCRKAFSYILNCRFEKAKIYIEKGQKEDPEAFWPTWAYITIDFLSGNKEKAWQFFQSVLADEEVKNRRAIVFYCNKIFGNKLMDSNICNNCTEESDKESSRSGPVLPLPKLQEQPNESLYDTMIREAIELSR